MVEIGIILTVQRSLILGRVTEERRKNQYFAKSYENIDKEHGPENVLISVNFVLKLHFEKSRGRRPQKYHEGREHFISRVCLHTLQTFTLICIVQYCQHSAVTR